MSPEIASLWLVLAQTGTVAPARQVVEPPGLPFRLGAAFTHMFGEDGDLARPGPAANAIGLDLGFGAGTSVRYHLGLAHQWESQTGYSARGFLLDLVSLGFPIALATHPLRLHVEPVVRVVRGQILFPGGGDDSRTLFRIQSGIAVQITAAYDRWFAALQPLSLDFRYFAADTAVVRTGFARLFSFQIVAGREF